MFDRPTDDEIDALRRAADNSGIIRLADSDLISSLVRQGFVTHQHGGTPRVTDRGYQAARRY